mgnify:CR=1 FL=1
MSKERPLESGKPYSLREVNGVLYVIHAEEWHYPFDLSDVAELKDPKTRGQVIRRHFEPMIEPTDIPALADAIDAYFRA